MSILLGSGPQIGAATITTAAGTTIVTSAVETIAIAAIAGTAAVAICVLCPTLVAAADVNDEISLSGKFAFADESF